MFKSKFFVVALLSLLSLATFAMPWTTLGPHRKPVTLVITANYKSPRLLAELIQSESRQPYLLIPAAEQENSKIIFCPAKKNGALEVTEADLNDFVRYLAPKRIIILGNYDYVPQKYSDLLDKTIPVVRIEGTSWARVADELNYMLNLSNLPGDFRRLAQEMMEQGGVYRPISRPQAPEAAKAPEAVAPMESAE